MKTAFDVAKPSVVSRILILTGVHGHLTAALLAEMQDVRESACFENSETEFRYSRCIRLGGVEALVLWGRVAKYVLWKAEEKWKAKGWGLPFGGQHDNEYVLRGMMWAGNCWLFCDNRERLVCVVDDIIEELRDLDMEPKQDLCGGQALTNARICQQHFEWEAEGKLGTSLFVKSLRYWVIVITEMGKDSRRGANHVQGYVVHRRNNTHNTRGHDSCPVACAMQHVTN